MLTTPAKLGADRCQPSDKSAYPLYGKLELRDEAQLIERPAASSQSIALRTRQVEKPWGRRELPEPFANGTHDKVGEIWFEHPASEELPILVKYIFTSEKLSVQVHPDDAEARKRGFDRGKTECWYVLDAAPGSTLGLGLKEPLSAEQICAAALDGSIEQIVDWKPVQPGDFVFVPGGTIHAVGAGISLLEFQQNSDVTFRLYDYGRPRELHIDDAAAVSHSDFDSKCFKRTGGAEGVLIDGHQFSLVRATRVADLPSSFAGRRRWVIPLEGTARAGEAEASAGGCLLVDHSDDLEFSPSAVVLVGVEGPL